MNAIEKMQQEGHLNRLIKASGVMSREGECPSDFGLDNDMRTCNCIEDLNECCRVCWNHALTKDYEGVND